MQLKNPVINILYEPVQEGESYSLRNKNFMAAFSAERTDGTPLDDPRYVKWVTKFMVDD